jgi:hypothetical protein
MTLQPESVRNSFDIIEGRGEIEAVANSSRLDERPPPGPAACLALGIGPLFIAQSAVPISPEPDDVMSGRRAARADPIPPPLLLTPSGRGSLSS